MLIRAMAALVAFAFPHVATAEESFELYIDADYSVNSAAAQAIELGLRTALAEEDFMLGGVPVALVPKDHRGNVRRSQNTFKSYVESPTAIAIIGGLHSPPYMTHKSFINQEEILTLLPWSAAGPVTRAAPGDENWIFRVSVDDTKSGPFLVREAVDGAGCERVALVLLDTGWGKANEPTLTAALRVRGKDPSSVVFFPTTVGKAITGALAQTVRETDSDCAILLANADNGAKMVIALADQNPDLRIFSHWGITGGSAFTDQVSPQRRDRMQIRVLQTCGLKRESEGSEALRVAMAAGAPDRESLTHIPAASGFVHGYDLGQILLAAAKQAEDTPEWQGSIKDRRRALKQALEALEKPVAGILKQYTKPFGPYSSDMPDAHEALGLDDLCLTQFSEDGLLVDVSAR